jgi:ankyrin repeat protein
MMYLLLKHGGKVDERDGVGRTALLSAASNAKVTSAKVLLSLGADIEARDDENNTPHAAPLPRGSSGERPQRGSRDNRMDAAGQKRGLECQER